MSSHSDDDFEATLSGRHPSAVNSDLALQPVGGDDEYETVPSESHSETMNLDMAM